MGEHSHTSRQPKCCLLLLPRLCCRQGSASAQWLTGGDVLEDGHANHDCFASDNVCAYVGTVLCKVLVASIWTCCHSCMHEQSSDTSEYCKSHNTCWQVGVATRDCFESHAQCVALSQKVPPVLGSEPLQDDCEIH